ncbi:MAG TPA: shikimate kinase [Acidimicrobiia bacterium]
MSVVWLVGVMGVGKTSAGRLAAERLGVPFADTDEMVEEAAGSSISAIWRVRGEEGFRELEADALARAAERGGLVATGGGAVLSEENRKVMQGLVIWLTASPETIASRIDGVGRPLLGAADVSERMKRVIDDRAPFYEMVATHRIATDELDVTSVADEIVRLVRP